MVSVKTPKTAKSSYAERVLGAFSQLQREHKKHAIHPAALRAQVKRDAQAKKDKLGPNWSHWVGRALAKMEEEGILEPATPNGSVALTAKGKKAIDFARRSVRQSIGASPGRNEDGLLWKQVVNFSSSKRPRRSSVHEENLSDDSDAYHTPSKRRSPKKRVRLSMQSPGKKLISQMNKAELRAELNNLQKKDLLRTFERELSPLTDLDSEDDEIVTTRQREDITEHDEETEGMRRQLFAARKIASVPEVSADGNARLTTPQMGVRIFDRATASSPAAAAANSGTCLSRKALGGIVRTESGSHIPNISRRPTPAPSSPGTDMEYDERDFTNGDDFLPSLDTTSHDNGTMLTNLSETRATQNGESSLARRLDIGVPEPPSNLQHQLELERRDAQITSLTAEINALQERVAEGAILLEAKAVELGALEEAMSGRVSALEGLIAERDMTIDGLGKEAASTKTELAAARDSWRRADEMVTRTTERLATTEAQIVEMQAQRESESCRLEILTKSHDELVRSYDTKQAELEQFHARYAEIEHANGVLQTEKSAIINEAAILRDEVNRLKIKVDEQDQALIQASADSREISVKNSELERSIAHQQADIVEKQRYSQELYSQLSDKERSYVQAVSELATMKVSADKTSSELSEAQARITSLGKDLARMQKEGESLRLFLTNSTEDLKSEESRRRQLEEELSDKERDLHAAQADALQSHLEIESLVAEIAAKSDSINRLSEAKLSVESRLSAAEGRISDLQNKLEMDRMDSSRAISALEVSLASATSDKIATREELARLSEEKGRVQSNLDATNLLVKDLDIRLEQQRAEKAAVEAGLMATETRVQEMEAELRELKVAKQTDEQSIATLKTHFAYLRDVQSKLFDEVGAKVDIVPPSNPTQPSTMPSACSERHLEVQASI